MGNQDSCYRLAEYEHHFQSHPTRNHPFFGQHQLLLSRTEPSKAVICKPILFQTDSEYHECMEAYRAIQRKPFSLVYPRDIIDNPSS